MGYSGMKRLVFSGFLVFAGGSIAACGGSDHAPPIPDQVIGTSGAGGKGGHGGVGVGGHHAVDGGIADSGEGASGSGGAAGDGGSTMGALAPVVSITSP